MRCLSFFRGRFRLGRECWHFEGQVSDTEKCIENLNYDLEYKPHYFITVFNSTYKKGSDQAHSLHILFTTFCLHQPNFQYNFKIQEFKFFINIYTDKFFISIFSITAGFRLGEEYYLLYIHKIKNFCYTNMQLILNILKSDLEI